MTTLYIYYRPIGSFSESSTISRRFFAFFHGNKNMIVERKASYVKFLTLRHLVERMQNELYLLVQEKKNGYFHRVELRNPNVKHKWPAVSALLSQSV